MKRVLMLGYDFPPQGGTGAVRITKFVKYLAHFGWEPVIVCSTDLSATDDSLVADIPPGTEIHRVPLPKWARAILASSQPGSKTASGQTAPSTPPTMAIRLASALVRWGRGLMVPDPLLLWVPGAVKVATRLLAQDEIDAIFTTSPPHSVQVAGLWLSRRFPHIPWVMDLRDLWSESHLLINTPHHRPNHWLERRALSTAARTLVVTDGIRALTSDSFPTVPSERIVTVTNGYDPDDLAHMPERTANERLTLSFVGTLYGFRSNTEFIPALRQLVQDEAMRTRILVRFIGNIPQSVQEELAPLIEMGVVQMQSFVSRREAMLEMWQADLLLMLESDMLELRLSHSNKLFEYMATGNPILAVVGDGEIAKLIRSVGAGVVVHSDDTQRIRSVLEDFLHAFGQGQVWSGIPASRIAPYQRQNLTRTLAKILEDVSTVATVPPDQVTEPEG